MNLERFLAERTDGWSELEYYIHEANGRVGRLAPEQILRLGELYRVAASDLALARRTFPLAAGTDRLEGLVLNAHALVYSRASRSETVGEFLTGGLWRSIRSYGGCLSLAVAILVGSVILGALWALVDPVSASGILPGGTHVVVNSHGGYYGISVPARGGLATTIFTNNIEVSIFAIAGGFTFGLLTVYSLATNGALLGVLGTFEWRGGGFDQFVRLIVPHGMLELSCIALAGAGGLGIARALIDPGRLSRGAALNDMVPRLWPILLGIILFLVAAGLTEGFITPWDLATPVAVTIGFILSGSFWAIVVWRGKPRVPPPPPDGSVLPSRLATNAQPV